MQPTSRQLSVLGLVITMMQAMGHVAASTQFASHVTVNTPARSFTHGVGDPLPLLGRRRPYQRQLPRTPFRSSIRGRSSSQNQDGGYPRVKPSIPFNNEDNSFNTSPWQHNSFTEVTIPVLPPSPYKVDSPDPESLWPEGLFVPPQNPLRFAYNSVRRSDDGVSSETDPLDPYLLEGSEAVAAVQRAKHHGHLYFHDIPHIESLLANQELRVHNRLKPHRVGSIRHTWPYNRP